MFATLKEKWIQYITAVFAVCVVLFAAFVTYPKFLRLKELKARNDDLSLQVEEKKREIAVLKDYQQRFRSDPDFVEKIARQNGRVFPGELVFMFSKD
ncbi:MAG: septum formation initiator family protein [Kiritimatiellae bacterium]|nr:septum formation initiator family protein [Kiritimatiellia bacterium]